MADKETPDEVTPNADEAIILANIEEVKGMLQSVLANIQLLLKKIG